MTRLFTGDYSTGNFGQWSRIINTQYEVDSTRRHPTAGAYPATIVLDDPDSGYCARFECRNGDVPSGYPSGERTEVLGDTATFAALGTTRWYQFSIKFDATFPTSHTTIGWSVHNQFKAASISPYVEYGIPVLTTGSALVDAPGQYTGYWYLLWNPQSDINTPLHYAYPILAFPLNVGNWHDIKMRIFWHQSTGTVQVWRNGVQQTFDATYGGGGTTFTGQTVSLGTGVTGAIYHEGIYRQTGAGFGRVGTTGATEIVYHKGFRMADSEDSL